jgi:Protein of unknown function (DUF4230)
MNKFPPLLLLLFIFLSCNEKSVPKQKQEILSLKEMSELATAEYSITKVVKANDNQTWFKVGERKILLSCSGSIKAGIDLSVLKEENILIEKKNITLNLPPAKVIHLNIPPESIQVEYEQVGFLRDKFSYAEQNELMIQAEKQIRQVADSIGIIQSAESNAKVFIAGFLKRLGYQYVTINFITPEKSK